MRVCVGRMPTKTSFSNGTSAVATLADTVTILVRYASKIYLYSPRKKPSLCVGTVFCCGLKFSPNGGVRVAGGGYSGSFEILGSSCSVQIFFLSRIRQNTPFGALRHFPTGAEYQPPSRLRRTPPKGRIFALVAEPILPHRGRGPAG